MPHLSQHEHCIVCGAEIPEGRQVCAMCEKRSMREAYDCTNCRNSKDCIRYPCYCINGNAYYPRREI